MKKAHPENRMRQFTVVIEQDEEGYYVASVPSLPSCYTQARTLEALAPRIREVIALCLAEQKAPRMKFVALEVRQRGSDKLFRHPDGRSATVPDLRGGDLGRGILAKILRDAGVNPEEFLVPLS